MNTNKLIRYTIFAGLWLILLIPFYVANSMFFPYITGKNFAFRIIIEIIFGLWVYLAYVDVAYRPKFSWLLKAIGLFVIVMALADFFAVNPNKAFFSNFERMDGWITLIHMCMYFLVFGSMMKTEKIWLWFFRSSLAMSMVMAIIAIREWLTGGSVATMTTLGNTIYVAIYFLFNFFFALILLYKDVIIKSAGTVKSILGQWLTYIYIAAAFLCAYGIWVTATRGVILGLIGGLIMTALIIIFFEKQNKIMRRFSISVLIIVAVIVGGFFAVKNTQFVKHNQILESFAVISWNSIQGQGQARQLIWPMAIKGFLEKPILGWGQEGFNYVFNKYYDPRMYSQEQWFDRAHNESLDVLVAGGALGLLAYLSIFVAAIYLLWKRRNVLGVTDAALLVGLLAGYFFQGLFVFDNLTSYLFFYAVLAYIHSRDTESIAAPLAKGNPRMGINKDMANYVVAPLLVLTVGASLWFFNIVPIEANHTLIDAMQSFQESTEPQLPTNLANTYVQQSLTDFTKAISYNSFGSPEIREQLVNTAPQVASMNIDSTLKENFVQYAYSQMQVQLKQTPLDARYQFFTGTFLDNIGQYQLAVPYLTEALALSPAKQTMMFELTKAYSYLGENDQALAEAKKAYELETDYADAKSNYIAAAIVDNDTALVTELLGANATTSDQTIVNAYLIKASQYLQAGDKNSAINEVEQDEKIDPDFAAQGAKIIAGILDGTIK